MAGDQRPAEGERRQRRRDRRAADRDRARAWSRRAAYSASSRSFHSARLSCQMPSAIIVATAARDDDRRNERQPPHSSVLHPPLAGAVPVFEREQQRLAERAAGRRSAGSSAAARAGREATRAARRRARARWRAPTTRPPTMKIRKAAGPVADVESLRNRARRRGIWARRWRGRRTGSGCRSAGRGPAGRWLAGEDFLHLVIPAKAGISLLRRGRQRDSSFRWNDGWRRS